MGKEFSYVVKSAMKNSMLTGIPQIVSARKTSKKVSRAIVFVLCLGGFIYQSKAFLDIYWQYNVLVDVQVINEEITKLPAITICNYHGIQTSRLCGLKPKACKPIQSQGWDVRINACLCTDRYCYENETMREGVRNMFPQMYYLNPIRRKAVEEIQDYVQPLSQLVNRCIWRGIVLGDRNYHLCNMSNAVSIRAKPPEDDSGTVCYTLNSLIYQPDQHSTEVRSTGYMSMWLNSNVTEYPIDGILEPIGVLDISFHNPYTVLNPYTSGFSLRRGKTYTFRLKKIIRISLPAPHASNCTDYISLWRSRGGYGPTNQQECAQECFVNVSIGKYGCTPITVDWPSNYAVCDGEDTDTLFVQAENCAKKHCTEACHEESYEVDMQSVDDVKYASEKCYSRNTRLEGGFHLPMDWIEVKLRLNRMQTTIYEARAQFEDIETFSYLGGYVGMWLGISLLAVFDFLETLYILVKYPLERNFKKQKTKMKIQNVTSSATTQRF